MQNRRTAYKIGKGGKYGNVFIDPIKLKKGDLEVYNKDNKIIYQEKCDNSLHELLTKRFNPKKKYSSSTCSQFNNLNILSQIKKSSRSAKSKLGGAIHYSSPRDMMNRLTIISGSMSAGNRNVSMRNEAWNIVDKLFTTGVISID